MTTALEGGEGSASRPGHSLPPGKTRYPLYRRMAGTVCGILIKMRQCSCSIEFSRCHKIIKSREGSKSEIKGFLSSLSNSSHFIQPSFSLQCPQKPAFHYSVHNSLPFTSVHNSPPFTTASTTACLLLQCPQRPAFYYSVHNSLPFTSVYNSLHSAKVSKTVCISLQCLQQPAFHYSVQNSLPLVHNFSHINPVHSLPPYSKCIFILVSHLRRGLPSTLFPLAIIVKTPLNFSFLYHTCIMPCIWQASCFHWPNNT
jgi:hypothetical protein